jgi:hypothetical protein
VTVAFRTTARTPVAGTPPRPVTCTLIVPSAGTGPLTPPVLSRVSRMRDGVTGTSAPSVPVVEASVNQPLTSTMTSVEPRPLKIVTLPPAPTLTMVRMATVAFWAKVMVEARGRASPVGCTVR